MKRVNQSSINFLLLILLILSSCKEDKKQTSDNEPIMKEVVQEVDENEDSSYYKNAIKNVLNAPQNTYPYYKGETGIYTFIKKNEIICFIEAENETPELYDDRFFANVYTESGQESLAFEYIDFEKNDVTIDGQKYMLAAFELKNVEKIASIQIGQYSKSEKKITWKVLIPKGRFRK